MRVAPGTLRRMVRDRDQCVLRITGADDAEAARMVLEQVGPLVRAVAPPGESAVSYVSDVMPSPAGPLVLMDAKRLRRAEFQHLLEGLAETAETLGLHTGVIEVPRSAGVRESLFDVLLAVQGTLRPSVDLARLPSDWLRVAVVWLYEPGWQPSVFSIAGVETEIGPGLGSIEALVEGVPPWNVSLFLSGSIETGMRGLVVCVGGYEPRLSLMSTGQRWERGRLRREGEEIRGIVRSLAGTAAYGYVTPVPGADSFGLDDNDLPGYFYPGRGSRLLPDELALDGFWYQVLGPGHLARTGPLPGMEPLGDGHVGLTIGEFDGWVDEVQNEVQSPMEPGALRVRGRALLAPCFLDRRQATALREERLSGA